MESLASVLMRKYPDRSPAEKDRVHLACRTCRSFALVALFVAVLLLIPGSQRGFAQIGTTATVAGTVTDPSGAALPGTTVTIKNVDTAIERSTVTLDSGNYVITELQPGKYILSLSRSGFKPYEQQNIILSIGQRATINVQLQVGTEQQRITVTASDVPVIQTEDSSIGALIESKTIVNTPLNGRLSIMGLMALAPGVQNAGAQDQMPVYGVTPSIGTGSRNSYGGVGYTLDGALNMMISLERGSGEVPPLDGIAEFKFLTSDVPAQFNQPAQVIVVSKGGGNQYHGMLVEFNRVAATAARDYFNNGSKPKYIRNEYGANFSGPIWIPGVYKGKDRSFFFFNWENFQLRQATTVSSTEPTTLMRQGIFSEWGAVNIVDPSTGVSYGNTIPNNKLNSVSLALQKVLFAPTTTSGIGTNTYENVPYTQNAKRFSFRIDHKFSDKDSIRGTYLRAFYGPNPSVGNNSLQGGMSGIGEHLSNHIVGWTHIFSPTLLTDVTVSYFHIPIYRTPQNVNVDFSSMIPGLGTILIEGAPQLSIKNIVSVAEQGSKDLSQDEQLNATVTKILARHTIKAGFSYIYDSHWNDGATSPQRGSYTFNATYNNIGTGYADFLLGYPDSTSKTSPGDFISRNQMAQYGAFVQDDWKLTPKLTINMGLRYDVQKFRPSLYGNDALYVPNLQKVVVFENSYTASNSVVPTITSLVNNFPIVLASTVNMKASLWDYLTQDKNNFAPRLGFAYNVLPKTVVRGAFGIFFNLLPGSYVVNNAASTVPYQAAFTYSQPAWGGSYSVASAPTFSMSNPFTASGTLTANPSVAAQAKTVTPYTEQYNLAVERELARGLSVRVGYVGQHNLKQNNYGGSGNTAPDINYPTTIAASAVQARRPVQPWSTISYYMDPIFHSTMNSLQVGAHKQYSSGLMLNAEYSWTRVLGTENFQSNYKTNDSYGNIGGLTPHVFVVSYSYPLPFGQGKTFLATAGNAVNKIVGGWQLSGITNVKSGQPFSATYSCSGTGCVSGRADRVVGQSLYPGKKTLAQWFNPAAFTAPTAGGTAAAGYAYGNSAYNMLWGPHYQVWDMNLQKTTTWADKINLQLRADAFNVFNHPNFSTPNSAISNTKTVGTITSTISNIYRTVEFGAKLTF